MKFIHCKLGMLVLILLAGCTLEIRAATVTATLDPAEISMGDSTQLTVTVTGAQDQPTMPNVDGLDITPVGQSTQIEIVNGSMTANASNTYAITPQHDGTFVIPAIRAGNTASQPVTLHVFKGAVSSPAPAPTSPPASGGPVVMPPPAAAPPASDQNEQASQGRFGSIQITLPKREFYVGELVPIDIKAYIPADMQASISDLPQFTSDGFTLNSLSTKPQQTTQILNGRPYMVVRWHSALTGIKAGDYPISLQMPLTVVVPQRMPQSDNNDDFFNSFFRNAMAGMGTKKDVTIQSASETLKVLPLPQTDRPAGFSGAVGQFEIEASASPTNVNVGDPITLTLKVTGTGNFDRVSSDMLASNSQWKTYSPKSHFDAGDSVGYQGTKEFDQPIIANDGSVSSIPSISFSFFDPESGRYVTRTTAPVAVTVTGNAITPNSTTTANPSVAAANPPPQNQPQPPAPSSASDLRPNKIESGTFTASLRPLYLNPWFLAGQGLPLLALLAGLGLLRRQRHMSHPERMRATSIQQAIRQEIEAMDAAMRNHQTDAFFIHARGALQQRLGQLWKIRPETITLADLESRLGAESSTVRPIFEMADQASYSDLHFADADLREWKKIVLNELAEKN